MRDSRRVSGAIFTVAEAGKFTRHPTKSVTFKSNKMNVNITGKKTARIRWKGERNAPDAALKKSLNILLGGAY